jgi:hypothetical protein
MKKTVKSQVSIEMLLLFGFMMMVLMAFLFVIGNRISEAQLAKERAQIDDVGQSIESEIKLALSVGGGYRREIYIPYSAGGLDYNITFLDAKTLNPTYKANHTELVLRLLNTSYNYELVINLPKNVYGSLTKGRNVITKPYNGSVILNQ